MIYGGIVVGLNVIEYILNIDWLYIDMDESIFEKCKVEE